MKTLVDHKKDAKNLRDLAKKRKNMSFNRRAASSARNAIIMAREGLKTAKIPNKKTYFASELADSYGILGGIHRRWGLDAEKELLESDPECAKQKREQHLIKSIKSYDVGFRFETNDQYGIVDSYNNVNRLVSRILYNSSWLSHATPQKKPYPGEDSEKIRPLPDEDYSNSTLLPEEISDKISPLDVQEALEEARDTTIREKLKENKRDAWALADWALVTVLLGEEDSDSAYKNFFAETRPNYVYESAISVIEPLTELELTVSKKSETVNVSNNLKRALQQIKACLEEK